MCIRWIALFDSVMLFFCRAKNIHGSVDDGQNVDLVRLDVINDAVPLWSAAE
jgi:hypothetical protein